MDTQDQVTEQQAPVDATAQPAQPAPATVFYQAVQQ